MRRFWVFPHCGMVIFMQDTRNLFFTNRFLFILLPFSKFFNSFCSSALFLCICSYKRRWKNTIIKAYSDFISILRLSGRGSKVLFLRPSLYFFFSSLSRAECPSEFLSKVIYLYCVFILLYLFLNFKFIGGNGNRI